MRFMSQLLRPLIACALCLLVVSGCEQAPAPAAGSAADALGGGIIEAAPGAESATTIFESPLPHDVYFFVEPVENGRAIVSPVPRTPQNAIIVTGRPATVHLRGRKVAFVCQSEAAGSCRYRVLQIERFEPRVGGS